MTGYIDPQTGRVAEPPSADALGVPPVSPRAAVREPRVIDAPGGGQMIDMRSAPRMHMTGSSDADGTATMRCHRDDGTGR
jgi:hypothetical protein